MYILYDYPVEYLTEKWIMIMLVLKVYEDGISNNYLRY